MPALCTLLVQSVELPHGKWLLFTVASVSLPYADDVGLKAKKRMLATLFLPFKRATATRLLIRVCREPEPYPQLYYELVIQAHLQEEKRHQNARELDWDGAKELLEKCREAVRAAHRERLAPYTPALES